MTLEPLGNRCYQRLWPVEIEWAKELLPCVNFQNSGGTNGWVARPEWLDVLFSHLGLEGKMTFSMLRLLPPGQGIPPHVDLWENIPNMGRRFHVPLISHCETKMAWPNDGVSVHLAPGWLWEVCFTRLHEVINRTPVGRIHAHFNVV